MLTALSPVDGRYRNKTKALQPYFSEFGLIHHRIIVEVEYFCALAESGLPELSALTEKQLREVRKVAESFDEDDAQEVKNIEKDTNHDVKAVEYFLKEQLIRLELGDYKEFVHFGLTSQDINNTAIPLSLKKSLESTVLPLFRQSMKLLKDRAEQWRDIPMLARTHGQPASPTLMGKELYVFVERLEKQLEQLKAIPIEAKFGGATGNLNAHYVAYPERDWISFADDFVENRLGLKRQRTTTQIEHYDNLAALFHALMRINTIWTDCCRDIWTYISMEYFRQNIVEGEVGSSTMPHKINPIDFENAEGNLGMANAIFDHLANKLPISRLQRDLTDSTVTRNIGVPIAHTVIAMRSVQRGLSKLELNKAKLSEELDKQWIVLSEAIQTVLRKEGVPKPYEMLKKLTRGNEWVDADALHKFIDELNIDEELKSYLKSLTPAEYTGRIDF